MNSYAIIYPLLNGFLRGGGVYNSSQHTVKHIQFTQILICHSNVDNKSVLLCNYFITFSF